MVTHEELKEWVLTNVDLEDILLLLDINATELLDRFEDKLELRYDQLSEEIQGDILRVNGQEEEIYDEY